MPHYITEEQWGDAAGLIITKCKGL